MADRTAPRQGGDRTEPACTPALALTGERTLPGIADERYWFARHVVAYEHAARAVRRMGAPGEPATGPRVLDAGCGEGYGLAILAAAGAVRVIGVDLEPAVVAHVRRTYATADPRVEVLEAELGTLPLADEAADVTVSFQVIEHLHDVPRYLASLRRVTARSGTIRIATPNRLTFTPDDQGPLNPFHTREFAPGELTAELEAAGLEVTELLGVRHGARLAAFEARRGTDLARLLSESPACWDDELREVVHATAPRCFEVTDRDLGTCLDLLAACRVPA